AAGGRRRAGAAGRLAFGFGRGLRGQAYGRVPARGQGVVDVGDAVGARLLEPDVEGAAVLPGAGVAQLDGAAVGRGGGHVVQPHRHVVGEEQLVRDRAVEGHPRVVAVDHGLRGDDPLLVRGGR